MRLRGVSKNSPVGFSLVIKIAACDDSCPETSYLQPCKEISSGHRNAYSTLASYSSINFKGDFPIKLWGRRLSHETRSFREIMW